MAKALRNGLTGVAGVSLLHPVQANELFVTLPKALAGQLMSKGHRFYPWPNEGADAYRLVTSFSTAETDVAEFLKDCQQT